MRRRRCSVAGASTRRAWTPPSARATTSSKYANGRWDARTGHSRTTGRATASTRSCPRRPRSTSGRSWRRASALRLGRRPPRTLVKIHAAYAAFMDAARIEAAGAAPIAPDLAAIREVQGSGLRLAVLDGSAPTWASGARLFDLEIGEDEKAPDRYAVYLGQGGLGLPDRDYYLEAAFAAKKAAYEAYVAQLLTLAGWSGAGGQRQGRGRRSRGRVALASWSRADRRDPDKTYHPTAAADLRDGGARLRLGARPAERGRGRRRPDGSSCRRTRPCRRSPRSTPDTRLDALEGLGGVPRRSTTPRRTSTTDLRRRALRVSADGCCRGRRPSATAGSARWLSSIRGHGRSGRPGLRGAVFSAPEAKAKIDALVAELRVALGRRIDRLDWMSPETKAQAQAKLARFTVKIAYPDKWRDYSRRSRCRRTTSPADARAFSRFEWERQVRRLGEPVDRTEWGMTPQTVNAYYNPDDERDRVPRGDPRAALLRSRTRMRRRTTGASAR